jgi:hypothetical protein
LRNDKLGGPVKDGGRADGNNSKAPTMFIEQQQGSHDVVGRRSSGLRGAFGGRQPLSGPGLLAPKHSH